MASLPSAETAKAAPIIQTVETTRIRVPLARTYHGSSYRMAFRSTILTRVHTSTGTIGEAYVGDEDAGLAEIDEIIHTEIAPRLLGTDSRRIERSWENAYLPTRDILRDRRLGLVASAAVDTAIWDAIGKQHGEPLWRLWGGYRDRLPMVAIGGYYGTELEPQIENILALGVAGLKLKVGGASPEQDAERFALARRIVGPDFMLGADANQAWTTHQAIRFARTASEHRIDWFEEPCLWANDRLAMRDVRMVAGVKVTAGQSEHSAAGCRDLMAAGAIDVCNFDASWSGGPTEWRRVAAIARAYDVEMGHHEEPQVASHLLAAIPHAVFVECFDPDRDPIWWNLVANRPKLERGVLRLPDAPGFGWEFDLDFIAKYRIEQPRTTGRGGDPPEQIDDRLETLDCDRRAIWSARPAVPIAFDADDNDVPSSE